jgi:hypothetical protein
MITGFLAELFATIVGGPLGTAAVRRARTHAAERGMTLCGLRVLSGSK